MTARVVVLTGAGASADSGIPTFRDADGLWENHRIEDVASPVAYRLNPALVHEFYDARRRGMLQARPNPAHLALARLEEHLGDDLLIVTQNVDDLHERAGSKNVIHIHGSLTSARCTSCGQRHEWNDDLGDLPPCPTCGERTLRPDIVWFGEDVLGMPEIQDAVDACETFVVIGTSGNVWPAAGFAAEAHDRGAETILLNLEHTGGDFDVVALGHAAEIVPEWVDGYITAAQNAGDVEPDWQMAAALADKRRALLGRVESVFIDAAALIDLDKGDLLLWGRPDSKLVPRLNEGAGHFAMHPASRLDHLYRLFVTAPGFAAFGSTTIASWYSANFGSEEGYMNAPMVLTMDKELEVDDWIIVREGTRRRWRGDEKKVIELGSARFPDWRSIVRFLLLRPDIHGD